MQLVYSSLGKYSSCVLWKSLGARHHPSSGKSLSHLSGGVFGAGCAVGLMDEVIWLWEEVNHMVSLIIVRLVAVPGRSKEERIYPEQDLEEIN